LDRFLLGKEIKRRRVELKLTQKQLAFGICKQSIISKVENGDFFPSFELLIALSNRLKLSISYLLESAISDRFYYINDLKKEVNSLITNRRYEEAFKISDREIQTNENLIGEHKEFFVSTRAVTAYYTNTLSFNESISFLKQCFIENNDYINQDQKLINRNFIAVLYAENGYSEKALEEFEGILIEFENKSFNHFYLRVLFNYANLLHNCALFEKTLFVIKEAIEVCKKVENVNMFGKFYFLKGECLIDLGYNKEDITPCFEKALFYFDMIHNDDYIKILWDRYSNYL
jgi:transcriptional regulator with XRE-family HTH domain